MSDPSPAPAPAAATSSIGRGHHTGVPWNPSALGTLVTVSYTHLTLPTNREV